MHRFENWTIAYRKRKENATLLNDTVTPFNVIKNNWRYWRADPHLFEWENRTYIFAEMYDRILRRGVIGCCELKNSGATSWKVVLKTPFHLSYPHVFEHNGIIYMIPESYVAEEIALYQAVEFPIKWEKVCTIKKDFVAVDTTLLSSPNTEWMFTLKFEGDHKKLIRFKLNNLSVIGEEEVVSCGDLCRPAGKFFYDNKRLIRPAQDCSKGYGDALVFYEVKKYVSTYEESLILKISPQDIHSNLNFDLEGVHTYNLSENYEVIDLKGHEKDLFYPIMRIFWGIVRIMKKRVKCGYEK